MTRISEELEVTYKTAWLMLHKICQAMRKRDAEYTLAGIIELDDAIWALLYPKEALIKTGNG
ncbi:hypothetical protein NDK43_14045 [Neobacillus pocheonensis]|uniref:MarR family transcriptional regulator n=1 Tax=Neobacillus pocheonensis TaxID=363869 RepID=A0ABT0WBA4_9BACI|nr:hypothetical protein [Neobacillus pocheonensis]